MSESPVSPSNDPTINPYAMENVPKIEKMVGIVQKCDVGEVNEKGSRPVSISVAYPADDPNQKFINGTVFFHPERMKYGYDNSDLGEKGAQSIAINKRQLTEFAKAGGLNLGQLIEDPQSMVGVRVAFSAGPQKNDGTRYQFSSLYTPRS